MQARHQFLAANSGVRAHSDAFVLLVHARNDGDAEIGVGYTVTKRVGNAAVRNRVKRRFRALAHAVLPQSGIPGANHVLIGKPGALTMPYADMMADLSRALAKAQRKISSSIDMARMR